ncbi:MAG: 3-phosphoglycerate dehydrogenase [Clostridiales bacterium]|nr:3-phosphoglycerate dehydrogenase [Clostridiales bacterium]
MFKIKILNKISKTGLNNFNENYIFGDNIEKPDAIIVRSFLMQEMEFDDSLLTIARAGSGINNIPINKCNELGIVVFNTPGANSNAVKELVIAGMLLSSRKIYQGINWVKNLIGKNSEIQNTIEKEKNIFAGTEIKGKTLGVIGLGAIGIQIANAALCLGMEVLGYDPYISIDNAWGITKSVKKASCMQEVFKKSDYITVHITYTEDVKEMFNITAFSQMKRGVKLLNFSREELINTNDICYALENGTISCYVTDFGNEKLLKNENVLVMPHLGASTIESEENCAVMSVFQIRNFLENGNIKNSVNFPNCEMSRDNKFRITLTHKNIPNMIKKISEKFVKLNINIDNMINKSRNDNAYTIIDTDNNIDYLIIEELKSIKEVTKVRII